MKKTAVAIVFGGMSSEHEVSCNSTCSVLQNIDQEKFTCYKVGITKNGRWLLTNSSAEEIASGNWLQRDDNRDVTLSVNRECSGLILLDDKTVIPVDCVFPVMHGLYGEDGTIQGLCEMSGIPYVGCNVPASACSIDKLLTKRIVNGTDVRQADFVALVRDGDTLDHQVEKVKSYFVGRYPLFVKPAREGSSVGISKVDGPEDVRTALEVAFRYDRKVLVEEGIKGREIEIAVLGYENTMASDVGEIVVENGFYSYDSKYGNAAGGVTSAATRLAKDIPEELRNEIRRSAQTVYAALGCGGLSRVDFFLTDQNEIIFNEINTMPGFTKISMYPKLMEDAGVSYTELITRLIESAIAEGANK